MRRYNVEVFDRAFNLLDHTNVSEVTWSVDYLSPTKNTITFLNCNAHKGDYIRVHDRESEFFGIITAVKSQSEKLMSVECASFLSVFDMDVLFDTDLQNGTSSLETVLKNLITAMFVSNSDTLQRIPGLSVETTSNTTGWGFNLKSDTENMHHCIVNFYNSLIVRALEKYGVVVTVTPDVQNKAIVLSIGKIADNSRIIETNLPNIVEKKCRNHGNGKGCEQTCCVQHGKLHIIQKLLSAPGRLIQYHQFKPDNSGCPGNKSC